MKKAAMRKSASTTPRVAARGLSLIELLVAMAISLVIVIAAAYVYLGTREAHRALDRASTSMETGTFALQLLGREIENAGFYPAIVPPNAPDETQKLMYDTYPPLPNTTPPSGTDWAAPAAVYQTAIYGCSGGRFDPKTATCPVPDESKPDSIVLNHFSSDSMGNVLGQHADCEGGDPASKDGNMQRSWNTGDPPSSYDNTLPPGLPIFVSNRYGLDDVTTTIVDGVAIQTNSLVCSGNANGYFGAVAIYQPLLAGVIDLRFKYGIYDSETTLAPTQFYAASDMAALPNLTVNGVVLTPWARVTAVRVCMLTRTLGGNTRLPDDAAAKQQYLDCDDTAHDQPKGDTIRRHVQVFGVRNALRNSY
ncbi:PilW family protein [Ramlibacter sp. H39-3-26]|uniref:PilW family protein n=1 Tax=Curvibacter soli TaxID=3031331 RepID=UPI0023DBC611|nr:PilW family protein [Ramlibacter sp. H39-3-26]MDF1483653.1 PilW family protein [Ramlibacter sp. H39-3-26]